MRLNRYHVALEEENGDLINDAIVKRNRAVEDELNVNIELIPLTAQDRTSSEVLRTYIMAQEDVVQVSMQMASGMGPLLSTDGLVVNLNDIPTLDLSSSWWNQNANEEFNLYGKQLTAVGDMCLFNLGSPVVVYFSKKLVETNQLENPYQLVYDGKWTFDTMAKMSADTANDINGNTEMDAEDIFGFGGEGASITYFYYASGMRYCERDSAGELSLTLNTEKTADLVAKVIPFLRNANTNIYSSDSKWADFSNKFVDLMMPKLTKGELLFFSNQLHVALSMRDAEYDFGVVPMPKWDESQKEYYSFGNGSFSDYIVVPSTNTNLEMTGHFLDAMGHYAQEYITPAFIDYSIMDKAVRDEDSANMINMIYDNQVFDVGYVFNWGSITGDMSNMVKNSQNNWASGWAEDASETETAFAETIKQLKGQ